MFYLYVNGDLISCCESFTEIYSILFQDIFNESVNILENTASYVDMVDNLIRDHHACLWAHDPDNESFDFHAEVWYG